MNKMAIKTRRFLSPYDGIVIRPMLVTAQKNIRTIKDCPIMIIESCYLPPAITREELDVPGSRCFLLNSFRAHAHTRRVRCTLYPRDGYKLARTI